MIHNLKSNCESCSCYFFMVVLPSLNLSFSISSYFPSSKMSHYICWYSQDNNPDLFISQITRFILKHVYIMHPKNMVCSKILFPTPEELYSPKHGTQLVTSFQSPFLRHLAIYLLNVTLAIFSCSQAFIERYHTFNSIPIWTVLILALVLSELPPFGSFLWHFSSFKAFLFLLTLEENRISKSKFNKN